jgi:hypothetical protein
MATRDYELYSIFDFCLLTSKTVLDWLNYSNLTLPASIQPLLQISSKPEPDLNYFIACLCVICQSFTIFRIYEWEHCSSVTECYYAPKQIVTSENSKTTVQLSKQLTALVLRFQNYWKKDLLKFLLKSLLWLILSNAKSHVMLIVSGRCLSSLFTYLVWKKSVHRSQRWWFSIKAALGAGSLLRHSVQQQFFRQPLLYHVTTSDVTPPWAPTPGLTVRRIDKFHQW